MPLRLRPGTGPRNCGLNRKVGNVFKGGASVISHIIKKDWPPNSLVRCRRSLVQVPPFPPTPNVWKSFCIRVPVSVQTGRGVGSVQDRPKCVARTARP